MTESRVQRVGTYALITAEGHVLLSLLNRGPNRGKWALIGGGIEFGESPKEALLREIKEEAGIEMQIEPSLLEVSSHQHRFTEEDGSITDKHFIGIVYRIELPNVVPCKADGDGFSSDGTQWFPIQGIDPAILNPSVIRVLKNLGLLR